MRISDTGSLASKIDCVWDLYEQSIDTAGSRQVANYLLSFERVELSIVKLIPALSNLKRARRHGLICDCLGILMQLQFN